MPPSAVYPITALEDLAPDRHQGYSDIVAMCVGGFELSPAIQVVLLWDGTLVNTRFPRKFNELLPPELRQRVLWVECEKEAPLAARGLRFGAVYLVGNCRTKIIRFRSGKETIAYKEGRQQKALFTKLVDGAGSFHERQAVSDAYKRMANKSLFNSACIKLSDWHGKSTSSLLVEVVYFGDAIKKGSKELIVTDYSMNPLLLSATGLPTSIAPAPDRNLGRIYLKISLDDEQSQHCKEALGLRAKEICVVYNVKISNTLFGTLEGELSGAHPPVFKVDPHSNDGRNFILAKEDALAKATGQFE